MTPILIELPQDPYRKRLRCADLAPGPKCRFTVTFTPTAAIVLILDRISAPIYRILRHGFESQKVRASVAQWSAVGRFGTFQELPKRSSKGVKVLARASGLPGRLCVLGNQYR